MEINKNDMYYVASTLGLERETIFVWSTMSTSLEETEKLAAREFICVDCLYRFKITEIQKIIKHIKTVVEYEVVEDN